LIGKVTGEMGRTLDIVVNCGEFLTYGLSDVCNGEWTAWGAGLIRGK
jgi:hypothetical protein